MRKTLLFDFDGTLNNPFPRLHTIHTRLSRTLGIPALGYDEYVAYKREQQREPVQSADDEIKTSYYQARQERIESSAYLQLDSLYEGVTHLLSTLASGHDMYIVSLRGNRQSFIRQIEEYGISRFFQRLYTSSPENDHVVQKSSLVALALKRHGISPDDASIIGDTEADIQAGKQAGIQTIAVTYGMRDQSLLHPLNPDFIVHRPEHIIRIGN